MTDQDVAVVDIRRREPGNLTRAYGLNLKLLQPWAGFQAPFRGAWCMLNPGDESWPHAHGEAEFFVVMSGRAELIADGTHHEIAAGDLVFMPAGIEHRVVNPYDEDCSYYSVWWDRAMSEEFLGRTGADGAA